MFIRKKDVLTGFGIGLLISNSPGGDQLKEFQYEQNSL